jgi:hypothetical protein
VKTVIVGIVAFVVGIAVGAGGASAGGRATSGAPPALATIAPVPPVQVAPPTLAVSAKPVEPVVLTGTDNGKTRPVTLNGNYSIEWTSKTGPRSGGNFIAHLQPVNGSSGDSVVNSIFEQNTTHSATTQVYNRKGDYYFDVIGGGDWTFKITPL